MSLKLLPLVASDLDKVWQIEQVAHIQPWSYSMIENLDTFGAQNYALWQIPELGSLQEAELIGYFYSQFIVDESSLMTIAIDPKFQGQGYGRLLMEKYIQEIKSCCAVCSFLEVRPSNTAAVKLYQSLGFQEIARRKDYYSHPQLGREDALVMQLSL